MDAKEHYNSVNIILEESRAMSRFKQILPHIPKTGTLIDIGCGEGKWINYLNKNTNLELTGIDISDEKINFAKNLCHSAKFISADASKLCIKENSYNTVTILEVIEHIEDWKPVIETALKIASKKVIISVPYNEKLTYVTCTKCKSQTPLDGHLHSFTEDIFKEYNPTIYKLKPQSIFHYIKRAFNRDPHPTICINCNSKIEYSPVKQRGITRIKKIINRSPENILVIIEKPKPLNETIISIDDHRYKLKNET